MRLVDAIKRANCRYSVYWDEGTDPKVIENLHGNFAIRLTCCKRQTWRFATNALV
jgi:hypothetical protein